MPAPQRILIVNRHYWPEISTYAQILRQIASRWVHDGHHVDVLTAHPSYRAVGQPTPGREFNNGARIIRVPLLPFKKPRMFIRLANSLPFFWGLFWHLLTQRFKSLRYDLILVATNPPIVEALFVRVMTALFGGRYIYHLQDIHPEVEESGNVIRKDGLPARLLRMVDGYICSRAAACVTLSEDMRRTLEARGSANKHNDIRIINNFIFEVDDPNVGVPEQLKRAPGRFRVIFAGNVGFFQGLEALVAAGHDLSDTPEIEIVFVGDGIAVNDLRKQAGDLLGTTVKFLPLQPMAIAQALVEDADLAVISLKTGVIKYAYPSKTMTYAASGTPILAIIDPGSELAATLENSKLGTVVPQGDSEQLAAAILTAFTEREESRKTRTERKAKGQALYSSDVALEAWSELVTEISGR